MPLIPEDALRKIQKRVESQFPEMKGVTPREEKITLEPEPEIYKKLDMAVPKSRGNRDFVELYYHTNIVTEDGFEIPRTVRVLVDGSGTIRKITTSK